MEKLIEKLHKAVEKYGPTDKRTVVISQELDNVDSELQKKLIKPKKDLIWVACTNDKYQLPVFIGNTANELGKSLGVTEKAIYKAMYRGGRSNGYKIFRVDVSREMVC